TPSTSASSWARAAGTLAKKRAATARLRNHMARRAGRVFAGLCISRMASLLPLRLEEKCVGVGAVDRRVAQGAGLILLRLVVEARHRGRPEVQSQGMALQAEDVHLAALQQPRIRRAVGHVASNAALDLHDFMLVDERTSLVRMALETDRILRGARAQLVSQEAAVGIVAIRAADQSLVHPVVKGATELLFDLDVAAVTKLRLLFPHQEFRLLGMVRRMAVHAAHVVLQVHGAGKV